MVKIGFGGQGMGRFCAEIRVGKKGAMPEDMEFLRMLVDTGAGHSAIPQNVADRLGVEVVDDMMVGCACGNNPRWSWGLMTIEVHEKPAVFPTLISPLENFEPLLGADVLESLNIMVDVVNEKLVTKPGAGVISLDGPLMIG